MGSTKTSTNSPLPLPPNSHKQRLGTGKESIFGVFWQILRTEGRFPCVRAGEFPEGRNRELAEGKVCD